MMHRCSGDGSMVVGGPCSCGYFHSQNNPFSMIFSHKKAVSYNEGDDHHHMYSFGSVPVVDCTLSLGTPSSTLSSSSAEKIICTTTRRSPNCMSTNFRNGNYDLFHPNISPYTTTTTTTTRGNANFGSGGGGAGAGGNGGCETLLARRCANCDTTSTPLWRNGPKGPKSLCNACGIRYKKEERRATAAAATGTGAVDTQHTLNNAWVHHSSHNQKSSYITASPYGNEFRFIQEDDTGSIPFLSWRLNVSDRPGLIHNLTTT